MRRVTTHRKNAFFVDSHEHGTHATSIFSIVESCRHCASDPLAHFTDTFAAIMPDVPNDP